MTHSFLVILLVEETAANVVIKLKAVRLVLKCKFILFNSFVDFSDSLIVVSETRVDC